MVIEMRSIDERIGLITTAIPLVLFLRETRVAAATLRIPRDYLELHRKDI